MSKKLAVIGGTGLTQLENLEITRREVVHTPYGEPSGPVTHGKLAGKDILFLARHGYGHTIPPHRINYRANLWALKELGVTDIIAVAAVGGIADNMGPEAMAVPDQIIDYTYGRAHTFFEKDLSHVTHVDFTYPYTESLRQALLNAAASVDVDVADSGTYGATQGPRLETAAEVARLKQDGCTIVGMTGMPEAVLARELDLNYACYGLVVNWAAGIGGNIVTMEEIEQHLKGGMNKVKQVLAASVPLVYRA